MKIYLIGGPPKCGKTTLSKKLSQETGMPYISTDTLESILQYYLPATMFSKKLLKGNNKKSNDEFYTENTIEAIKESYISQAKTTYKAIRSVVETSIIERDSIIIEGFHITPELVYELQEEFGKEEIEPIFLVKTDVDGFLEDIHKSSTPNDWILKKTKEESTFRKIAEMIISYSLFFMQESEKYKLEYLDLSEDFIGKIDEYINNNVKK